LEIVAETEVVLIQLNVPFILSYLRGKSDLAMSFYATIAQSLTLFTNYCCSSVQEVNLYLLKVDLHKPGEHDSPPNPMLEYFPILSSSTILHECEASCHVTLGVNVEGCTIITATHLLFQYSVMGQIVKRQIDLSSIKKFYKSNEISVHIVRKKKDLHFKFKNSLELDSFCFVLDSVVTMCNENSFDQQGYTENFIKSISNIPTSEIWELFQTESKYITNVKYTNGDRIIKQGKTYSSIFIVHKGSCRIQRELPSGKIIWFLSESPTEEIYGETSLLFRQPSPVSLVAIEDAVEIFVVHIDFFQTMQEQNPHDLIKFFLQLCRCISDRLVQFFDTWY